MNPFEIHGARRALPDEAAGWIAATYGIEPVMGLAGVVHCGGHKGGASGTPFFETSDTEEWILPLSANDPLVWETDPIPQKVRGGRVGFLFGAGFGNGSPLTQPTGQWNIEVNGRSAISVRVVKHSQRWRNSDCAFAFDAARIESAPHYQSLCLSSAVKEEAFAAFGPAVLVVPADWIEPGQKATIKVTSQCRGESARWFMASAARDLLRNGDFFRLLDTLSGKREQANGYDVFFGDIHTHSGQVREQPSGGCGTGTWLENYDYASGPAGIDFYCLSDHESQVPPDGIEDFFQLADRYDKTGVFATLRGYEFTSVAYGHRNIYFRGSGGTVINASTIWEKMCFDYTIASSVEDLWSALEACGEPFISVPHHPSAAAHPFNWDLYNPKYERLVEVFSLWGSSEYHGDTPRGISDRHESLYVRDALKRGLRFGLIASSDGHDGQPGNGQRRPGEAAGRHAGSGWAAVLTDELRRDKIFDSLNDRRCYGTTGVPIILGFDIDGRVMGSELPAKNDGPPVLRVSCRGANGIDHIRIIKNGQFEHTRPCHGEWYSEFEWADDRYDPSYPAFYYVRVVQVDGESAWSSPIWIG